MTFDLFLVLFYKLIAIGSVGYFAFTITRWIMPDAEVLAAQQRLGVESAVRPYRHFILKWLSPFYRLLATRVQKFKMPHYRQNLKATFVAAGISDQFDPDEFVALKVVSSFLALVFAFLFAVAAKTTLGFNWAVIALIVGFFIPDYSVRDLKLRRQKSILRQLPTVMDLLTLSVEAGLDFMAAISRVIFFSKDGPLKDEFNQMLKELQLGTVRADALRNLADRVQIPELSSFATILIQADQMGSSIGPVLRAQSDLLRSNRFQKAEREGAKATQKLLIPLITCILPAVFIVILGPVICDIFYNQTWFASLFGGK